MKSIGDANLNGKKVFVRADYNVPVIDGVIADTFRIDKSFATINHILNSGGKVILASHIEGASNTLRPVYEYLEKKYKIVFISDYYPVLPDEIENALSSGAIVLLENLRKYHGEKNNDLVYAKHLAGLADIYVNEAFAASHRSHASIVGIPNFIDSYAGFILQNEIENLSQAFHPEHPFVFALGGAKFETKLPLIRKFFSIADSVFIGGALANDFFKAKGINTGMSLLSDGLFSLKEFFSSKLILPIDVLAKSNQGTFVKKPEEILPEDYIVDVGPDSIKLVGARIKDSRFILWNGPLGNYEAGFKSGTHLLAKEIADSKAKSVVGGGDTIASIAELGLADKFTFISTGGGAMLEFLANETLPGIEALS